MIKQDNWHGVPIYTMENDQLLVSLCPSFGNNLFRIWDKIAEREVLRVPANPEELKKAPGHYGTPLMMPPNRIRQGAFSFRDRSYQFELNSGGKNHIHGFLRSRPWTVTDSGQRGKVNFVKSAFSTADFPEVLKQYPHPLIIEITYELNESTLTQKVRAINQGASPAPYGFGLHTWFLLDGQPEEWSLQLPASHIWELDEELMPTGNLLPLGEYAELAQGLNLQGQTLDTVFEIGNNPRTAVLSKDGYEIRYTGSELYKHWVIFTQGEAKDYICLEPYTWVTNAPNLNLDPEITGLQGVEPGGTLEMDVVLEIIRN